jgi:hypothetical protein
VGTQRLERGRDKNPSPQVLQSLARMLRLDQLEQEYLRGLAAPRPRPQRRRKREHVPERLHQLLVPYYADQDSESDENYVSSPPWPRPRPVTEHKRLNRAGTSNAKVTAEQAAGPAG